MKSAFLSTPFDVGGAVGAIGAGMVADKSRCPALTCLAMLVFAFPAVNNRQAINSEMTYQSYLFMHSCSLIIFMELSVIGII